MIYIQVISLGMVKINLERRWNYSSTIISSYHVMNNVITKVKIQLQNGATFMIGYGIKDTRRMRDQYVGLIRNTVSYFIKNGAKYKLADAVAYAQKSLQGDTATMIIDLRENKKLVKFEKMIDLQVQPILVSRTGTNFTLCLVSIGLIISSELLSILQPNDLIRIIIMLLIIFIRLQHKNQVESICILSKLILQIYLMYVGQQIQSLMKEQQPLAIQQKGSNSKTLQKYKKRLLFQVIAVFSICLLIILERIFYQVIIESEEQILSNLQVSTDLVIHDGTDYLPDAITGSFLEFFGKLSKFRYQFFLLTHLFITLYVAFDALITTKIIYVSMGVIYVVSLLQLFYGGARPFWTTNSILSCDCLNSYTHPSIGLVLMLFVPYYFFYCSKKKAGEIFLGNMSKKELIAAILILVLTGVIQFLNYFTGTIFILNIALSIICSLLMIMIAISINTVLDQAVKKSTIIQVDAKKYVFYWLLFICLLMAFVLIVYSGQDVFLDIDWVRNFISCTNYHQYDEINYRYDQVVGPWFNFLQTATLFAWIGAVFGISFCYRKMSVNQWSQGSIKNKIIRVLVGNILIIPSWIFVVYLQTGSWIQDIGLNEFIVDAVHYFILYIWLFGLMPVYILQKLLKLTNRQNEDYYVILQEKK